MPAPHEPTADAPTRGDGAGVASVQAALARIERDNSRCQALSGVFAARALAEARQQDRVGSRRSPVAGQPLVVKDMIDTTPGVCSAGLEILNDYRPPRDAEVVARLRGAGAIVVGVSTSDCAGFNVRSPAVRHPDAPALTVGGSSGGSAAALRAGFAAAALGTDTGGSVRIPAACCGVVGFKPGFGRLPVAGVRPLSPSLDHVGTLVPRVRDLAAWQPLLDPSLGATRLARRPAPARIGVDRGYFADADREVRDSVEAALRAAQAAGMPVQPVALPDPDTVQRVHLVIFAVEAAAYYGETFHERLSQLPVIIQRLVVYGNDITRQEYDRQCRARDALRAQVDAALERVDFLILPTLPVAPPLRAAPRVAIAGREHEFTAALIRYTALFNHTGHPALAMPYGRLACGLPASLQVAAPRDGDEALIEFGMALEDLFAPSAAGPGSRQP